MEGLSGRGMPHSKIQKQIIGCGLEIPWLEAWATEHKKWRVREKESEPVKHTALNILGLYLEGREELFTDFK